MVQWLRLCTFTAKAEGSIPGGKIKTSPHEPRGTGKKIKIKKKKAQRNEGTQLSATQFNYLVLSSPSSPRKGCV